MEKNYIMIKVFGNQRAAREFAVKHYGTITIQYDWDDMLMKITRQYVVRY